MAPRVHMLDTDQTFLYRGFGGRLRGVVDQRILSEVLMNMKLSRLLGFVGGIVLLLAVIGPQVTPTMAYVNGFTADDKDTLSRAGGKPLCDVDVTLTHDDPEAVDIHMSLNLVLICGKGGEPDVVDTVKGNGFYTLGDSETNGGRLRVVSGRYTDSPSDPNRVIVVQAVNGGLKGTVYNLYLSTINGCAISGRFEVKGSGELSGLTGRTNCIDAACGV